MVGFGGAGAVGEGGERGVGREGGGGERGGESHHVSGSLRDYVFPVRESGEGRGGSS